MRIALAGNPNSGKTTMFNALCGQSEKVGNWAGVTVDKKEHKVKGVFAGKETLIAVDLPGAYSMSPFTSEESVTSTYVREARPEVIINIVDADNLSRSLFFTTQLLELGIPMVVALNKSDLNEKKGTVINTDALAKRLACPVVSTVSTSKSGLKQLVDTALSRIGSEQKIIFSQADRDLRDKESSESADRERFAYVNEIVAAVQTRKTFTKDRTVSDKIDAVLTSGAFGIPIFALVMFLVFYISQSTLGAWIADGVSVGDRFIPGLVPLLDMFKEWVATLLVGAHPLLLSILVDGVIGGVTAVVGFLPLVMVMYFLIALLEDMGYMSRAAIVLDPIFKKVGLSGKSAIPFVMTVGCAVPGIMASRTIHNERERRATAMLAPFMPCGAKIPVIALFAGAFFDNAWWVSALMYFAGIALIFIGALLINLLTGYRAKNSFFIIEIPEYKAPSFSGAFRSMCARGWSYIVKAATIILLCNMAVQLMQTFTWSFAVADSAEESILASIATPIAYLIFPIVGVLSWQLAAAAVTGFIAKENIVGTLAVCFVGLENLVDMEELAILEGSGAEIAGVMAISKAAALAYLIFNLYSPPCFAAIGAMSAEMKSARWLWGGIALQLSIGYTMAYLVYTVGTLIYAPASLNIWAATAGLAFICIIALSMIAIVRNTNKKEL